MSSVLLLAVSVTFMFRLFYYAIGEPMGDYNPHSIFSKYSYMLCLNRLKKLDSSIEYKVEADNKEMFNVQVKDIMGLVIERAKPHLTYEYILGLCPTCTFFWLSIITIFIPSIYILDNEFLFSLCVWSSTNILNKIIIKWT